MSLGMDRRKVAVFQHVALDDRFRLCVGVPNRRRAFPVRIQSKADLAARNPWRIEAWENPFARDGPASPFLAGERPLQRRA